MGTIGNFRPMLTGLGAGALVGGGLAWASTRATPDDALLKNVQYVPMLALWNNVDAFRQIAQSGNPAAYGRQALVTSAIIGAGAVVGANTLFNTVTTYNTIDEGLNDLEAADFRSSHLPRAILYPVAGSALGAALVAVPSLVARKPVSLNAMVKPTVMLGLAGGAGAMYHTALGQGRAYRPSTEDVDEVAVALFEGTARGAGAMPVDTSLATIDDGDERLQPAGRSSSEATSSRFYALADRAGNGDGLASRDEVRAHVASFDIDGDGAVEVAAGEWKRLHDAVVEGVTRKD